MNQKVINRRKQIAYAVQSDGEVTIAAMSERFSVTTETIRSDFDALVEEQGFLRFHGGIRRKKKENQQKHYVFHERELIHASEKKKICHQAIGLISDGDCIYLDSGSTVIYLLEYLGEKRNITIVTHSIAFLMRYMMDEYDKMFSEQGHRLLFLGGEVDANIGMTFGTYLNDTMAQLHFNYVLFSVDALDAAFGCSNMDLQACAVIKEAVKQSDRRILLADKSKFDSKATYQAVKFSELSILITDKQLTDEWKHILRENGVDSILVTE